MECTNQFVEDARIEGLLLLPAVPHLHVVVLETPPVRAKFRKTVLVDVGDAVAALQLARAPPEIAITPQRSGRRLPEYKKTYTDAAHLVTLLPSFKQSSSPRPFASCLQSM